jgi:hypothetical protein
MIPYMFVGGGSFITLTPSQLNKMKITESYKLFSLRKNGTTGPLFINRSMVVPINKWLKSECIPTKGFSVRAGWHACSEPTAPHLSNRGRVLCKVDLKGVTEHLRPASQGGLWYTAKFLMVTEVYL